MTARRSVFDIPEVTVALFGFLLNFVWEFVTATGKDVYAPASSAYDADGKIDWPAGFCQRDIGS
ncbi:hypothetical protein [Parvularcula oceani]|uniref:hypothetical protein n=1 Tax=Parvularcula oceani TaxID=1247963 RepID=UPI0004E1B0BC|nr:hypothetical protein [Parvularcula oceani]